MSKEFCLGLALGMIGGALIAVNCKKVRGFIRENQTKILNKLNKSDKNETAETETNYR